MLLAGDEIGHTQNGNNNAYCQDNEISWLNWNLTPDQESLLLYVRRLIAFYWSQPVFHRRRFFHGKAIQGSEAPDIAWLDPSGGEMSDEAWKNANVRCLGVQLFGANVDVDSHGESINGDTVLILFNADHALTIPFKLPSSDTGAADSKRKPRESSKPWLLEFDTAGNVVAEAPKAVTGTYDLQPCSLVVLRFPAERKDEMLESRIANPQNPPTA
jgi:glycogen operon protein